MSKVPRDKPDRAEYRNVGVDRFDGDRLKRWRLKRGMSQNDLAVASHCSGAVTIWRYEVGRRLPNAETTRNLAAALGIETSQLMKRDCDRCMPGRDGERIDVSLPGQMQCEHVRGGCEQGVARGG